MFSVKFWIRRNADCVDASLLLFPNFNVTSVRFVPRCRNIRECDARLQQLKDETCAVYIPQWQFADALRISRMGINRIQEIAPALFTGRKSRANPNKPEEDRRSLATYDFERDEVLFIGTFAAAHGEARAESRVFPCAWAARSRVNYLDKSAYPPVRAMMVLRSTKLGRRFRTEGDGRRTCFCFR